MAIWSHWGQVGTNLQMLTYDTDIFNSRDLAIIELIKNLDYNGGESFIVDRKDTAKELLETSIEYLRVNRHKGGW